MMARTGFSALISSSSMPTTGSPALHISEHDINSSVRSIALDPLNRMIGDSRSLNAAFNMPHGPQEPRSRKWKTRIHDKQHHSNSRQDAYILTIPHPNSRRYRSTDPCPHKRALPRFEIEQVHPGITSIITSNSIYSAPPTSSFLPSSIPAPGPPSDLTSTSTGIASTSPPNISPLALHIRAQTP